MTAYFIRRLLLMIPTFIGITLLVFIITRFVPGGPVERMIAEYQMRAAREGGKSMGHGPGSSLGSAGLSEEQKKDLEAYFGLDKPVLESYLDWLGKLVHLDFGVSSRYGDPVLDTILKRMPISLFYGLMTTLLTYLISIPLGIMKGIKHHSAFDTMSSFFLFVGYALPPFAFGVLLILILASHWGFFPLGGFVSDGFDDFTLGQKIIDIAHHAFLPLCTYMIGSFTVMTMLMKNSLMDNIASDYVRTAIAKGVSYRSAVVRHALRNSLIPLATSFGNNLSLVMTGSFLVEKVFNINGMGLLGFEALVSRDYTVVMGILVISSFLMLIGNILSDICVALVDPRVQFE